MLLIINIVENSELYSLDNIIKKLIIDNINLKEIFIYCREKNNEFTFIVQYQNKKDESFY